MPGAPWLARAALPLLLLLRLPPEASHALGLRGIERLAPLGPKPAVPLRKLYAVADYFAINVSSPNTRGLRELQSRDALAGIVEPLQQEREGLAARHGKRVPPLVKISPDLDDEELHEWPLRCAIAPMRWYGFCGINWGRAFRSSAWVAS